MHVEVLKISQEIDMKTGQMSHVVSLKTNNGQVVIAKVSDEAAQALIAAFVATGPASVSSVVHTPEPEGYREDVVMFGGEEHEEPAPPAPPPVPVVKRKIVGTDSFGYPLFERGGVDPSDLSAGDSDEDGIGSL